ncbi:MAG: hydrogenase 4 subunit B [Candidatus Lambdaproteobacteria bacterium]|nr:hydrogenase 4 subunit B [Candidatus Lambdaproteobacteria bacterium]
MVPSLSIVAALLALGVLAVPLAPRRGGSALVYVAALLLTLAALAPPVALLLAGVDAGTVARLSLPLGIPWLGAHFRIDALSAFFLVVVNLGGAASSLYSLGYGRHEPSPGRVLPFYCAFLAGMNLVVLADDAFSFLLAWEFMSLSSWALVMAHHREPGNALAGFVYLTMASFGTLSLLLAFGVLAGPEGAYTFEQIRSREPAPLLASLALVLVLLGAGSKAGLVPLHAWLPLAHPAAPSQVSALMSGVMTKVAVYGFVRIVFDLLGEPQLWWSMVVLALGGITSALGVLYALMQHDLKKLLAYHTVENIGIIFIGLGLAMAFRANAMGWAAALALTAALFHVLNHSLFKSLLFFGAGAVLTATGERDMEKLGGLIHRMPRTAFAFLAGSAAISALPPLNGFVSEWLTFQAMLVSPQLPQWGLKFLVPAVGALLALSAALAAACFVKAFGVTFLGRPRSERARTAREVDGFAVGAMFALALLCLLAGVLPGVVIDGIAPVTQYLLGGRMPEQLSQAWLSIVPITAGRSSYNGLLLFAFIALSMVVVITAIHRLASHAVRRGPAWDCGFADDNPRAQYTAGSFAQPIRRVFGTLVFAAREHVTMPSPGDMAPARLEVRLRDPVWELFYAPIAVAVGFAADRFDRLQFLTIRKYLSLVFGALILLLLVLVLWAR